uniref:molybdopterin molybdotransferase n=1 Tax=Chrysotila carterae TaxID=13221 RepID=A0A7S4B4C9_CHRCT|mmetsp:Transcript_22357/g.48796  ORF Transcript_22357/g.48796 Transcript_22357/m.48796 type:complete len:308 (+) Transcript_22357:244-1167(+)
MASEQQAAEAYAFRQLVKHLQMRKDVQNIDLMILSGFCRNCLSKWYHAGLHIFNPAVSYEEACEHVYGMPYAEWKKTHQAKASEEQLRRFEETKELHAKHEKLISKPALLSDVCCTPVAQTPLMQTQHLPLLKQPDQRVGLTVGILTVSDRAAAGIYSDLSGPEVRQALEAFSTGLGAASWDLTISRSCTVADDSAQICAVLREWSDSSMTAAACNLVLTTGGTGLSPRDVTPEATLAVVDRVVPGIPELLLREAVKVEPLAALSRAAAGVRGRTLIVNLPGRPAAVKQNLSVLLPLLGFALLELQD